MEKLDKAINKTLFYICSFLMLLMAILIFSQVISRYVMGKPFTWSEELGRYIFVWMSFLGMAVAVRKGAHVALDILLTKLNGVNKKILMSINNIMVMIFGICLTYAGFKLFLLGYGQKSPTLKIPMQFIYIVIPISGVLLIYFVISQSIQQIKDIEEAM